MIFRCASEPLTHPVMIHRTYSELPPHSQTKGKEGGRYTLPPLSSRQPDSKHMEGEGSTNLHADIEQKSAPVPVETGIEKVFIYSKATG